MDDNEFSLEWEERSSSIPFKTHIIAGSIAGISEHAALMPVDNIKTQLQSGSPSFKEAYNFIRSNGITSFYRGSGIIALGCLPSHAIYFLNYELLKIYFQDSKYAFLGNMLIGGASTIFHDIIMTPCEMLKQRNHLLPNVSVPQLIQQIYQVEGIKAFWRSFPVNMFNNLPNSMCIVSVNETIKSYIQHKKGSLSLIDYFASAGIAGAVASVLTTPLDNVKTRLNIQMLRNYRLKNFKEKINKPDQVLNFLKDGIKDSLLGPKQMQIRRDFTDKKVFNESICSKCSPFASSTSSQNVLKYPNTLCSIKIIMKEEGIAGFWKGLTMKMILQSTSTAISWSVYELIKLKMLPAKVNSK